MPDATGKDLSQQMLDCIETCLDCHRACLETVVYCLQQGGRHAEANHVRLMFDCAEICQTSANFMLRGSDLHYLTCGACAEVCRRCAEDCARMADDNRMAACAEECRRCAESCQRMSGGAAAPVATTPITKQGREHGREPEHGRAHQRPATARREAGGHPRGRRL